MGVFLHLTAGGLVHTYAKLFPGVPVPDSLPHPLTPPPPPEPAAPRASALDVAKSFLGDTEGDNTAALEAFFHKAAGMDIDPRQTAWCSVFMNAVEMTATGTGSGSMMAKSWLDWGVETNDPTPGTVAIMWRTDPNGPYGHVTLYTGDDPDNPDNFLGLGGNQSDSVSIASFPKERVLGWRNPPPPTV